MNLNLNLTKDIDQFFEEGRKKLNLDSTGKLLY